MNVRKIMGEHEQVLIRAMSSEPKPSTLSLVLLLGEHGLKVSWHTVRDTLLRLGIQPARLEIKPVGAPADEPEILPQTRRRMGTMIGPIRVACPRCGASPGEFCQRGAEQRRDTPPHQERKAALLSSSRTAPSGSAAWGMDEKSPSLLNRA